MFACLHGLDVGANFAFGLVLFILTEIEVSSLEEFITYFMVNQLFKIIAYICIFVQI